MGLRVGELVAMLELNMGGFGRDMRRARREFEELGDEIDDVADSAEDATDDIADSFRDMSRDIGRATERVTSDIANDFRDMGRDVDRAADRAADSVEDMGRDMQRTADRTGDAFDGMGSDIAAEMRRMATLITSELRGLRGEAAQSASRIEQAFSGLNFSRDVEREAEQAEQALEDLEQQAEETGDSIADSLNDAFSTIGGAITGGFLVDMVNDSQSADGLFKARTGMADAEFMKKHAQDIKDIYLGAWGESKQEVAGVMADIYNILGSENLKKNVENAFTMQDIWDEDTSAITRSIKMLMDTFGKESQQAFDMVNTGFSKGLNYADDFLDTIDEYSRFYKDLGFTAEEFFGTLEAGKKEGLWDLDKLADATKEFQIILTQDTDDAQEALAELFDPKKAEAMIDAFRHGKMSGKEILYEASKALAKVEHKDKRSQLATALMGTPSEDIVNTMPKILESATPMDDYGGSLDKSTEEIYDTVGVKLTEAFRKLKEAAAPLAEAVADSLLVIAEASAPLIEMLGQFLKANPILTRVAAVFGILATAISGAMFVFGLVKNALTPIISLFGRLGGGGGGGGAGGGILGRLGARIIPMLARVIPLLGAALSALATPVGLVIAAIAALVAAAVFLYLKWDEVSAFLSTLWTNIVTKAEEKFTGLGTFLSAWGEGIKGFFTGFFTVVWEIVSTHWEIIKQIFVTAGQAIWAMMQALWETILTIVTTLFLIIVGVITGDWELIKEAFQAGAAKLGEIWSGLWEKIKTLLSEAWENIKSSFNEGIANVTAAVGEWKDSLISSMTDMYNSAITMGSEIVSGFINGILSMGAWAKEQIGSFFGGLVDKAKGYLRMKSPSRLFMDMGVNTILGYGKGLGSSKGVRYAAGAMQSVLDGVSGMAQNAVLQPQLSPAFSGGAMADMQSSVHVKFDPIKVNISGEGSQYLNDKNIASSVEQRIAKTIALDSRRLPNRVSMSGVR